ncbi:SIR2 family protein [Candidatus Woesebacteria bacterium]|nr:SIR2 family protein [Candidatus Woesebacteria bacterium]
MEDKLNQLLDKITKLSQVSHLNFLFGSGASDPFIPPQTNIEKNLDQALNESNTDNEKKYKKEFFEKVIHPCIEIKDYTFTSSTDQHDNLTQSYTCYRNFLIEITKYILARKSPLLNKQANIFTTNIDIFFEKTLEDIGAYYNDGFIGHMKPIFRTSYYQTIIKKKSEYSEQQSEVPTFNLYKLHGSVTWEIQDRTLFFSDLSQITRIKDQTNDGDFISEYNKLQIVNPNYQKFSSSVLAPTYYEMLRLYASELEKENSVLFVLGFSFEDKHILEITRRAMDANPTLSVCILCHSNTVKDNAKAKYQKKFENIRYLNNLYYVEPKESEIIDFDKAIELFLSKLNPNN